MIAGLQQHLLRLLGIAPGVLELRVPKASNCMSLQILKLALITTLKSFLSLGVGADEIA